MTIAITLHCGARNLSAYEDLRNTPRPVKKDAKRVYGLFDRNRTKLQSGDAATQPESGPDNFGVFRPVQAQEQPAKSLPRFQPKPQLARPVVPRPIRNEPIAVQPKKQPKLNKPIVPRKRVSEYDKPFRLRSLGSIQPDADYVPSEITDRSDRKPKLDTEFWKGKAQPARGFEAVRYAWLASNMHYNPLYFEDPQLERYGHTFPDYVQPFVSVGRFGAQLMGLPYQTAIDPIHKCVYPLGWYAPGECAPRQVYQVPWNAEAAGVEAGVALGLFFLIP